MFPIFVLVSLESCGEIMNPSKSSSLPRHGLLLLNIAIVLVMTIYVAFFVLWLQHDSTQTEIDKVVDAVESLSRKSVVTLDSSSRAVKDWAHFVRQHDWTAEEVLENLNLINSDPEVDIQLLDPETLTGLSAAPRVLDTTSHAVGYGRYYELGLQLNDFAAEAGDDDVLVTSTFTNDRNGEQSIAFVTLAPVRNADDSHSQMLLLRIEELEQLRQYWDVDGSAAGAQISLVNENGAYLIRSPMLKNSNFYEFLFSYNDLTYPALESIQKQIVSSEEAGWMIFQNAQGSDTVFAYSSPSYNNWYFIGAIEVDDLPHTPVQWQLPFSLVVGFALLMLINIRYYRQTQRQLNQNVKDLQVANAAKTRFLSSMSHDIRTPMNAIVGMTEVAQHHLDDPKRVAECLDKVALTSHHLLTLINDILDISRIESGKFTLSPQPFHLQQEVKNLSNIITPMAEDKGLHLTLDIRDVTEEYLVGDTLRLNQIWINILSNAVKYTPAGGHVTAIFRQEAIPGDSEHFKCIYQVTDDGIGMSEEYLKTVFEPFTREKDGRIDKIEGSGLGMAITKQMVDLMGGTITVQSRQNVGTTFTVTLTLARAPQDDQEAAATPAPAADAKSAAQMESIRLLVAEDNDLNWEVLSELLALHGIAADRAVNGLDCVQQLTAAPAGKYALIFMDIQMPVMNGYDAARRIRKLDDPAKANIPIVAMTADAFAEDVAAAHEAGMNGHLPKPIDLNLVLAEIQKYTHGKESPTP